MTVIFVTANIRDTGLVDQPGSTKKQAIQSRLNEVVRLMGTGKNAVAGGQEIETDLHDAIWNAAMKAAGFETYGQESECPLSLDTDEWTKISVKVHTVHGGKTGISPHRVITEVHATNKDDGLTYTFLVCHPVSKPDDETADEHEWRAKVWDLYFSTLKTLVATNYALGRNTVILADLNKSKVPKVHPQAVTLIESGLDHIYLIPAPGVRVTVEATQSLPPTENKQMDHPVLKAKVTLTPAGAVPPAVTPPDTTTTPPVVTPPVVIPPKPPVPEKSDVEKVLAEAKSHLGFKEGRSGGHWNNDNPFAKVMGWANFQSWCASFVCACFKVVGLLDLIYTPSAGVDQLAAGFKKAGRWSEYPAEGAIAFYGKPSDLNHTGLVRNYDDTYEYAYEGNTNDDGGREGSSVLLQKRKRTSSNIVGYGYPDYKGGIKSADPNWATGHYVKPGAAKPTTPHPAPTASGLVVDYSGARPSMASLKKANTVGVMRYLSHNPGKNLTHAEAKQLHDAGFWIGLVWETTANRAGQGAAAGAQDVKDAEAMADALGYPKGAVIFYAVDYDANPGSVQPYFHAVKAGAKRPVGIYGSYRVVMAGFCDYRWQATAWSHGLHDPNANLYQLVGGGALPGTDFNNLLHEFPVWTP
jgi:hypothetical protein